MLDVACFRYGGSCRVWLQSRRDITVQPFCQEVARKLAVIAKFDIG